MFEKVGDASFIKGEHEVLKFWEQNSIFDKLRQQNAGKPKWNFLDGPITANNPMGVHHAWGRTYKDAYQRYYAMTGHELRYQNGFDCQGLWVEVEVEKELNLGSKTAIAEYGIDKFVDACKRRVLKFAARQTEQSIRLGYWTDWDDPDTLRLLASKIGTEEVVTITTPSGKTESGTASELVARLGNAEWGGSYFTFSTENNETIWAFLKKCFRRGKIYRGYDVMPWSGRGGSAYSQMEVADGRKLTVHKSIFVRFPLVQNAASQTSEVLKTSEVSNANEFLLVWTTTPWTLTSNVAAAVNPDLDYVKLRSKRDGSVYYFAKDNLEYPRLAKEFKEGFGRTEWSWPTGVPKLKSIAQIFKEQGGYEIEATLKGSEMIGWEYTGPFDDLPAQSALGGVPFDPRVKDKCGKACHRVVDGGRDFKGNPMVVAGEGTGIVHIAPGCGDVDHTLGQQLGIVGIAPLGEDGSFLDGFGPFTGRNSTDPATAEFVFEQLKAKHLLVNVEQYPHIYPHCWRTGDELVFRLVDEWFINMDWRDEIKEVTESIRWLPDSVNGKERELEWLTSMRDWMISKKRFWGLALPIWVEEYEVNGEKRLDFEVMGSLEELKSRAVEGWEVLEGHTPHRPWIDAVKIKNPKTGRLMSRIVDVGNPWLDAGIVPFSTTQFNTNREAWQSQYPLDLVTECFPGQFRNWFYSMLSLATMMMWDEVSGTALAAGDSPETSSPQPSRPPAASALPLTAEQKRPFKTLLGHRLVMNEDGQPMHKSDGTAIWFEEAAEQLGVDTMRWMYLAHNPAQDLRFGTRHKDKPVTIETPDGPTDHTAEGLPVCEVVSKPADEVRRQILIPLWNSYSFFVNYARLDEFDPLAPQVPVEERPEIDRWILSNLQALIATSRREFENYNTPGVCSAAAAFIDDLSNWYIRRNRRRFWRSREASDTDKLAAYQTMYEVLVTLAKLLAPCAPFVCERMYQNLVVNGLRTLERNELVKWLGSELDEQSNWAFRLGFKRWPEKWEVPADNNSAVYAFAKNSCEDVPRSVHLCRFPQPDWRNDHDDGDMEGRPLDPELNERMALAQLVVKLGHKLREEADLRVRQPLAELRFACSDPWRRIAIERLADVIEEELNLKKLTSCDHLDDLVSYVYKPNQKALGPKYGKLLGAITQTLAATDPNTLAPLRRGESVTLKVDSGRTGSGQESQPTEVVLLPADIFITTQQAAEWISTDERGVQIALSTHLTPELLQEGIARDFVRQVQQLRKDANLEIQDRINVYYSADNGDVTVALTNWSEYLKTETLANTLDALNAIPTDTKSVTVGNAKVTIWIEVAK
ncbi:MAG: class I tRNA ligase family protein [Planctomycetia bacterium]|nr:class I tRNA ligase family protein [Planctomycetia bacterium]